SSSTTRTRISKPWLPSCVNRGANWTAPGIRPPNTRAVGKCPTALFVPPLFDASQEQYRCEIPSVPKAPRPRGSRRVAPSITSPPSPAAVLPDQRLDLVARRRVVDVRQVALEPFRGRPRIACVDRGGPETAIRETRERAARLEIEHRLVLRHRGRELLRLRQRIPGVEQPAGL